MARLRFESLSHRYGADQPWVLRDLQLDVADGEAHALLGPSGAGKSTLLSLLSGLLVPTEGRVRLDDTDVTCTPVQGRNIAQVFQFPVVYDGLSVRGNLEFPLRNRRMNVAAMRSRIDAVAGLLEITHLLDARPARLGAYDRQTVAMARALVRPDVAAVLLDEPLTAVEPAAKWRLRRALKTVQRELGVTMIYVTHDQLEALTFADRVTIIESGRILQSAPPAALFEDPAHAFVGHFIGSPGMNLLPVRLRDGTPLLQGRAVPLRAAPGEAAQGHAVGVDAARADAARADAASADAAVADPASADAAVTDHTFQLGFRPEDGTVRGRGATTDACDIGSSDPLTSTTEAELVIPVLVEQIRALGLRGGVPWGMVGARPVDAHREDSTVASPSPGGLRATALLQLRQPLADVAPGPAILRVPAARLRLFRNGWRMAATAHADD